MRKTIRFAKVALILLGILFFALLVLNIICPGVLSKIVPITPLEDTQWNIILSGMEILVAIITFALTSLDKDSEKCQYKFEIAPESLRFNDYHAFDNIGSRSYTYIYDSKDQEIEKPYYAINVSLTKNHDASVNVPFVLTVQKCPDANKIEINNVFICVEKNGDLIRQTTINAPQCSIDSSIMNGNKYLLRISLLCNFLLEKRLLEGRYIISMRIDLYSSQNQKITKYIVVELQDVDGKKVIICNASHNNYLHHKIWWMKRRMHRRKETVH